MGKEQPVTQPILVSAMLHCSTQYCTEMPCYQFTARHQPDMAAAWAHWMDPGDAAMHGSSLACYVYVCQETCAYGHYLDMLSHAAQI